MISSFKKLKNSNFIYWSVIFVAVIIGTIIRLKGLGKWSLALDEYYIVKSAENILKYGLPQFPQGGYYDRGILLQYFISILLTLGIKAELAARILPVLANLITIPPTYLIAKRIGNKYIALVTVVIFSFSIWEIEFARFARMYTMFQAVFMWYIYLALIDYENKNFKNYKWLLFLSGLSIFIYEGSLFLAVFNFIPFLLVRKVQLKYLISSTLLFIVSFILNRFNFRELGAGTIFPPEFIEHISYLPRILPIKIPAVLFPYSFNAVLSIIIAVIIIAVTFSLTLKLLSNLENKSIYTYLALLFLSISAIANQFGLFILSFFLFVFWDFFDKSLINFRSLTLLGLILLINFVYWYGFGIFTSDWYVLFDDFSSYDFWGISKRIFVAFFNYPDNYLTLLNYFNSLPILTLFSSFTLLGLFLFILFPSKNQNGLKFLCGTVIFLGLIFSIPELLYQETRYTFFMVPLVIVLVNLTVYKLLQIKLKNQLLVLTLFAFIIISVFALSRDFSLYHLLNIDKEDVNYRMIYANNYKKHLYRRWDVKTPTDYIKNNMQLDDVIMINENSQEYYLPKVDYFNFDFRHRAFVALSASAGKKEKWSDAKLIYKNDDLLNLIEKRSNTIWFIVYPELWLNEIDFYKRYDKYLVYQGIDKMLKVYKFDYPQD
ncbi:MAG: glycosyltransferase family 39 protein [Ignavibacteriales bacterium]|nr:glycosyltransferase family 39 protein [Ignavibacteriales bacterium]